MFIPAKIKLSEMILIALMQISCVVPDNPKRDENGTVLDSELRETQTTNYFSVL